MSSEASSSAESSSRRRPGTEHLAPDVRDAVAETYLYDLPDRLLVAILEGAEEQYVRGGERVYDGRAHEATTTVAVVVEGLLRASVRTQGGRQATIGYSSFGSLIGVVSALAGAGTEPGRPTDPRWTNHRGHLLYGDAIRDSRILRLDHARFLALAQAEVDMAWRTAKYVTTLVLESHEMLAADLFLNVRARVARHLLDLAERDGNELVVSATQQEIADAIGSVREVVSRTIARLAEDGVVERRTGRLVLRDLAQLHETATGS